MRRQTRRQVEFTAHAGNLATAVCFEIGLDSRQPVVHALLAGFDTFAGNGLLVLL